VNVQGGFALTTLETYYDVSQAAWRATNLMNGRLQNKRALVTGGSQGIGAAIVHRPAHEGVDVELTCTNKPEEAENITVSARDTGVPVFTIQADSVMPEAVTAAVDKTADLFGGSDILVNNAGIASMTTVASFSREEFAGPVATNVRDECGAKQAAIKCKYMDGRRIVSIGSTRATLIWATLMWDGK
jgi:3-oxoacyl-[acyl-carrier protein] reductase